MIRRLIDSSMKDSVSGTGLEDRGKNNIAGVEISKGIVNGEACTAAAVAAVAATGRKGEGRKRSLRLGRALVNDWKERASEIERDARSEGLQALECKRRRMQEFSKILAQRNEEGEPTQRSCFSGTDTNIFVKDAGIVSPMHAWSNYGGGRRGRNESITLRMFMLRTPGVLNGSRSRRRRRRYPNIT